MAMYEGRDRSRGNGGMLEQTRSTLEDQRKHVEHLAHALSQQSIQQWQKAIEGIVALPAAILVGFAATTLYAVGFVARGFEVFQQQAQEQARQMRELAEQQGRPEQQARRGQPRGDEVPAENRPQESVPRA